MKIIDWRGKIDAIDTALLHLLNLADRAGAGGRKAEGMTKASRSASPRENRKFFPA